MVIAHLRAAGPFSSPSSSLPGQSLNGYSCSVTTQWKTRVRLGWGRGKIFLKPVSSK